MLSLADAVSAAGEMNGDTVCRTATDAFDQTVGGVLSGRARTSRSLGSDPRPDLRVERAGQVPAQRHLSLEARPAEQIPGHEGPLERHTVGAQHRHHRQRCDPMSWTQIHQC